MVCNTKGAALGLLCRFAVLLLVLAIGALIFMHLEKEQEDYNTASYSRPKTPISSSFIKNLTSKHAVNLNSTQLLALFRDIDEYIYRDTWRSNYENNGEEGRFQKFPRWFYFCFVTLTTIGYGDMSPQTTGGKLLLIPYAIIGIPLMFSILASVGAGMTSLHVHTILNCQQGKKMHNKSLSRVYPILQSFLLLLCFVLLGSIGTSHQQNWSYPDSLYYWFSTCSTIGYGDYIANGGAGKAGDLLGWVIFRFVALCLVAGVIHACWSWLNDRDDDELALELMAYEGEKGKNLNVMENAKVAV